MLNEKIFVVDWLDDFTQRNLGKWKINKNIEISKFLQRRITDDDAAELLSLFADK